MSGLTVCVFSGTQQLPSPLLLDPGKCGSTFTLPVCLTPTPFTVVVGSVLHVDGPETRRLVNMKTLRQDVFPNGLRWCVRGGPRS